MRTTLVVFVVSTCLAVICAQPLEERFRRGIADPDVKFRDNEIDSSLQDLVRSKKSVKDKTSGIFIGKGIQKDVSKNVVTSDIEKKDIQESASQTSSSIIGKGSQKAAPQTSTSLGDLEIEKSDKGADKDADRSRRQQPIFISPVTFDGIAPGAFLRSQDTSSPSKLQPSPLIVSPIKQERSHESVAPAVITTAPGVPVGNTYISPSSNPQFHSHPCTCSCPTCIGRSADAPRIDYNLKPSYMITAPDVRASPSQFFGIEQPTINTDDSAKMMRAAQQGIAQQMRLQQQVNLLQQQMDQQRAVDQLQQLQIEMQKEKLGDQRSAELLDPDCTLRKLANPQLPKDILQQLVMMEQQRVQKIKDCKGKTAEPKELDVLSAIVEKEVELLEQQVSFLKKSDTDKKEKDDDKKSR